MNDNTARGVAFLIVCAVALAVFLLRASVVGFLCWVLYMVLLHFGVFS